jgi:HPt (histidine-containing phosphotransfer) domain-containing protein
MGEHKSESQSTGGNIDLTQFYQIFFEEAGENLDQMEQMLLQLDLEQADDEELNAIFRCAHSIKGGAATFGFADVAELTHQMESLLDKLRRHEQPTHRRSGGTHQCTGQRRTGTRAGRCGHGPASTTGGQHRTDPGRSADTGTAW